MKPLCGSPALPNRTTSPDGCCAGMWWYRATPGCIRPCGTRLAAVLEELERIEAGNGVDGELLDTIRLIAAIMDGMRED